MEALGLKAEIWYRLGGELKKYEEIVSMVDPYGGSFDAVTVDRPFECEPIDGPNCYIEKITVTDVTR